MTSEANRDEILELIVRWEEAKAMGQAPAPEEVCRDCPQLLSGFLRQVEKLEAVEWLNAPLKLDPSAVAGALLIPANVALPRLLADRYQLELLVGEGGFGWVFKGFDTWLERSVAVKIPKLERPVSSGEVDQCRIEARKVAQLRHPNIVPVHDVGRDGGTCFIVGDWIEGTTLAQRLGSAPLDPAEAARIVAEVADALEHAHRAGFVHRDIKPANILVDHQGKSYLTDFGIAAVEAELAGTSGVVGTLPYMAPEQLTEALGPVDHRADLYALGVVLFELLTGRRPFVGSGPVELREQILHESPPSPQSLCGRVPDSLDRICLRALAKWPAERVQRADHLAAELRRVQATHPASAE